MCIRDSRYAVKIFANEVAQPFYLANVFETGENEFGKICLSDLVTKTNQGQRGYVRQVQPIRLSSSYVVKISDNEVGIW